MFQQDDISSKVVFESRRNHRTQLVAGAVVYAPTRDVAPAGGCMRAVFAALQCKRGDR